MEKAVALSVITDMRCLQQRRSASLVCNPHRFVTFGAKGNDKFTDDELAVWAHLKAGPYYAALHACWTYSDRLPATAWLRLAMQTPAALDFVELARIFDEEVRTWQLWRRGVPRVYMQSHTVPCAGHSYSIDHGTLLPRR